MQKQLICDQQLVSQYLNGDESSLATLVELHKRKIFDYIYKFVKNKDIAEDVFQDTFFKIIETLKKGAYKEEGKFVSWALCIAHHKVMDYFRNKKRMKTVSIIIDNNDKEVDIFDRMIVSEISEESKIIKGQVKKKVRKLIRHLNFEQREMIILRHSFGMTFREIAERSDIPINTALGRMHCALRNLNKIIKEQGIDFVGDGSFQEEDFNEKEIFFGSKSIIH